MKTKTLYYSDYREEPFENKKDCEDFEKVVIGKELKLFDKKCLREDLNEKSKFDSYHCQFGYLFPELMLLKFFNVSPQGFNDFLIKRNFKGNWYTIHNAEEYARFRKLIFGENKEISEIASDNEFPMTFYNFSYTNLLDNNKSFWTIYDWEIYNRAKGIVTALAPEVITK